MIQRKFSQPKSSAHVQREIAPCVYVEMVSIKLTCITGGKCLLQMPIRLRTSKNLARVVMTYLLNYERQYMITCFTQVTNWSVALKALERVSEAKREKATGGRLAVLRFWLLVAGLSP